MRYGALSAALDERARRLLLGAEALAAGRGGQAAVTRATGASPATIRRGLIEIGEPVGQLAGGRIRRPGGGRKRTVELDPTLRTDLEALIEPTTRGDPESPLRWTTKSVRRLAAELGRQGHRVSYRIVGELLHEMGYSLQANRKTLAGTDHPDRNAQFAHLNAAVQLQLSLGQPVISVDTKKKDLVGPFRNTGKELRPKGDPERVLMHDFLIPELGRVSPYGVSDVAHNEAWVSVGTDHDTAAFAVESIRRWWACSRTGSIRTRRWRRPWARSIPLCARARRCMPASRPTLRSGRGQLPGSCATSARRCSSTSRRTRC